MTTNKAALEISKLEAEIDAINGEKDLNVKRAALADLHIAHSEREQAIEQADRREARIYSFIGKVDVTSVRNAMTTMDKWSRRFPGKDMTIIFNSPGGSVIDGLAFYDFLMELKAAGHKLTTIARGYAASMGGILLQAGDERIIGENCYVLIHEISSIGSGSLAEMEDEVKFLKRLQARCLDILVGRSALSKQQIKTRWTRKDWWLDSAEAVKYGFADKIG